MKYDIIIVGGGMVGAALGCALQNTDLRIALIDATTTTEDPRLIALNHSSCTLFKNLNIWSQLAENAAAINEVHVSYRGRFGATRITAKEMKLNTLGHVVPAKYINSALYAVLQTLKNVDIFRPATLKNLTQFENSIAIEIENENTLQKLETKILIGADGTHSTVRKLIDMPTEIIDYQQSAIVTQTELNRSHQNIAYERFHKTGAIAMLPLTAISAATIWSDKNENITQLMQLSDQDFLDNLQNNFGYRLGRFKKISKRFVFPLQMIRAKECSKKNILLIGNAARTLHPVASQGLNLALHEVAALTEFFAKENFENISFDKFISEKTQIDASTKLSRYLPEIFTSDFFMMGIARQLGLIGLDVCQTAKQKFANAALGRAGRVPKLTMTS